MKNKKSRQARKTLRAIALAKPVARLLKAKRALSPVISNLILIAAVIVVGFSVLAYANSQSTNYVTQYGTSVNSDIQQLKETISFEYAFYNATAYSPNNGSLQVYFLNTGTISTQIASLTVSNSTWQLTKNSNYNSSSPLYCPMYYFDNTPISTLNVNQQGYLIVSLSQAENNVLAAGNAYVIKLTTDRGSNFEYNFVA